MFFGGAMSLVLAVFMWGTSNGFPGGNERQNNDNGSGHKENGHKDNGHKDNGHKDNGHKDNGHKDNGHKDNGHKDNGHMDNGHKDNGHKDNGSGHSGKVNEHGHSGSISGSHDHSSFPDRNTAIENSSPMRRRSTTPSTVRKKGTGRSSSTRIITTVPRRGIRAIGTATAIMSIASIIITTTITTITTCMASRGIKTSGIMRGRGGGISTTTTSCMAALLLVGSRRVAMGRL